MSRTVTLIAAPLGGMQPGRPVNWDELPADARRWAEDQAKQENEMLTALDGDQSTSLDGWDYYVVNLG